METSLVRVTISAKERRDLRAGLGSRVSRRVGTKGLRPRRESVKTTMKRLVKDLIAKKMAAGEFDTVA